jgi:DNA-binding MarR family transcriptional regulator
VRRARTIPVVDTTPGARIGAALGTLLLRGNRALLYERLTDGVPGVDETSYPVLSGLARHGPCTASTLATVIGLDRTVTTRYASRLQAEGLLARLPDPLDRRATRLELTERGEQTVAVLRARLAGTLDGLLSGWAPEDAARFAADLERFTDRLLAP